MSNQVTLVHILTANPCQPPTTAARVVIITSFMSNRIALVRLLTANLRQPSTMAVKFVILASFPCHPVQKSRHIHPHVQLTRNARENGFLATDLSTIG